MNKINVEYTFVEFLGNNFNENEQDPDTWATPDIVGSTSEEMLCCAEGILRQSRKYAQISIMSWGSYLITKGKTIKYYVYEARYEQISRSQMLGIFESLMNTSL